MAVVYLTKIRNYMTIITLVCTLLKYQLYKDFETEQKIQQQSFLGLSKKLLSK